MRILLLCLSALVVALPAAEVVNANAETAELAPWFRENVDFHAVITVRNPYERAVKVAKIDTTCDCSKLELASKFLLPGETTTLTIGSKNIRRSGPQQVRVSLFTSDPDFDPIEVWARWNVRPLVAVDAIPPGQPALERPADNAWRDVYRFVANERPDEPTRLRKRIRLSCPAEELPPGGLRIEGIDYPGTLWKFESKAQENGSILLTATARDQVGPLPEGESAEVAVVRTNHPDKARIELHFNTLISKEAGRVVKDPMQEMMLPPPMPPPGR